MQMCHSLGCKLIDLSTTNVDFFLGYASLSLTQLKTIRYGNNDQYRLQITNPSVIVKN